ncbi:hypothetical protein ESB00_09665 [Oleiharenicola lentus]|uniref:Peptidase S55 domain-containing protein n=2 Tax=Oleiharenicola lentus TaxID=2508720 RepID=A0A4Q1CAY6_9BACT|nr:hypothetical protein ESB00_09665 [Oleiharenicola lentus]
MNTKQRGSQVGMMRGMALLLCSCVFSFAQPHNAPLLALEELQPGMKGEVWTVFRGSAPEPFAVQVTGVLRNALGPGKSMILCELTDPRVQGMGAVAGMSGSPLYIDGKLAGVLAYQIQRFETVRHAGFTPIKDMLEVSTLPAPRDALNPTPIPIKGGQSARSTAPSDIQPLTPAFTAGGLSPLVAGLVAPQFDSLGLSFNALGGSLDSGAQPSALGAPPALQPGGVVAVALAVGDITIAGTGTVSHVDGSHVLAFGHPMLSLGATELPMAAAEVVTILPSQLNSIKVSNTGPIIGAFSQDRLSGIYGELGREPAMVPVEISFPTRQNRKSLNFRVVRHEQVLPIIAASGLAQAVNGSNESGFTRGFRVTVNVEFPGREPVELSQIYPGPQGLNQGLTEFVGNLSLWLFNPYERVFPDRIRFAVEDTPDSPQGIVEQFQVSRTSALPGEHVDLSLGWRGFQRASRTEALGLDIPREWAGKDLEVIVTNGPALDELTGRSRTFVVAQLRGFDEYISALRQFRRTDGLYVAVVEKTRLLTDQRDSTAEMPGSLERIARAADEARFQRRDVLAPLWEQHILPGTLFNIQLRKPLNIAD